jgi:hypothetical protein
MNTGVVPMPPAETANYPTKLTDEQWQILHKLVGRNRRAGALPVNLRDSFSAHPGASSNF